MTPGSTRRKRHSRPARRQGDPHLRRVVARLRRMPDGDADAVRTYVGAKTRARLSARQERRLAKQLALLLAFWDYTEVARVRWGQVESARERFVKAVSSWWGRRLPARTFLGWQQVAREEGAEGLVDRRGRGRGTSPLDAELWRELCRAVRRGSSVKAAHRLLAERAERERRPWRALRTIQQRFADHRVRLLLRREAG